MQAILAQTLREPEQVVQSFSDPQARLYYRFYFRTVVGASIAAWWSRRWQWMHFS